MNMQDIFAAKLARRRRLAGLSIDEKVDLIERLHEMGQTMLGARESMTTGASLHRYFREGGSGVSEQFLDAVEAADKNDRPPDDPSA